MFDFHLDLRVTMQERQRQREKERERGERAYLKMLGKIKTNTDHN